MDNIVFVPSILLKEEYDVFTGILKERLEKIKQTKTVYPDSEDMREQKTKTRKMAEKGDALVGWSSGGNVVYDIFEENPDDFEKVVLYETVLDWYDSSLSDVILLMLTGPLPRYTKNKIGGNRKFIELTLETMTPKGVGDDNKNLMTDNLCRQGGEWLTKSFESLKKESMFKDYKKRLGKLEKEEKNKIYWITHTEATKKYADYATKKLGAGKHYHFNGNHMPGYCEKDEMAFQKLEDILNG